MAQVRADREQLLGAGGPLDQRGERRREAVALLAGLDPPIDLQEPPPPFGDRAIRLRVGPSLAGADLLVGVALGLEQQRRPLVGLERAQRLGGAPHALAALDVVLHVALRGRRARVEVDLLAGDGVLAGAADRHRLVADDHLEPGDLRGRLDGVQPPHVDLERPLEGVLSVVGAQRRGAGDPQQLCGVARHDGGDAPFRVVVGGGTRPPEPGRRHRRRLPSRSVSLARSASPSPLGPI